MKKFSLFIVMIAICGLNEAIGQWNTSGNNIFNSNSGNVGIGNNTPTSLLYVAKSMTEPTITVRNLGGGGGATYVMLDDASGANWKFKVTLIGGFKIRDHANLMDVITIEPNSFANAIYITSTDNLGIGTATPANSALVDINSTTKGFLPPRMTAFQIEAISNPANGLMVFNTSDEYLYVFRSSTNEWMKIGFASPILCGMNFVVTHIAGTVAPITKTVTYGSVETNLSGSNKCWITQNLGASQQASSPTDALETSAGWYWQFNLQQGYRHDGSTRTPNTTWITSINENNDWQVSNDPCLLLLGPSWRLPTYSEWNNVLINGGWDNRDEAYASVLKLHCAGLLHYSNGSIDVRGSDGIYWSSSQNNTTFGWYLNFGSGGCSMSGNYKAYGFTTRCLKD